MSKLLRQSGLFGGVQFQLIYNGTSNGVWTGASPLVFTPGFWIFTVTQTAFIMLKGCGPGGQGGNEPNPPTGMTICGGGGGGAYTLGSGYTFRPGIEYHISVTNPGTEPTYIAGVTGGTEWILYMNAGAPGRAWNIAGFPNGAPGGTPAAGIAGQMTGGNGGRWNPTVYATSTTGTGGGGQGANGNLSGSGTTPAGAGGNGESPGAAGLQGNGYNGGCGGYGGGLLVGGYPYGRGAGGAGEMGNAGAPPGNDWVNVATSGVIQMTKV